MYVAMQHHNKALYVRNETLHIRRYLGLTIDLTLLDKVFIRTAACVHPCSRVYLAMVEACITSDYVLQESWESHRE
jgi:hypothetical protein